MTPRIQRFDPHTADVDTLRRAYLNLLERHAAGHEDRHLGWWIRHNATDVTLTTATGATIFAAGDVLLNAIKKFHEQEARHSAWRAA